jgi:hypothetical protein
VKGAAVVASRVKNPGKLFTSRSDMITLVKLEKYNNQERSSAPSAVMKGHSSRNEDTEDII